jgi:RNA polymerase sigma-70 factor (ECF subfamily)
MATPIEGIGEVFDQHAPAVHRYLSRRVGSASADDLLSDVFVIALRSQDTIRAHPSGSPLPWLYGVARNLVYAHCRRRTAAGPSEVECSIDWDAVDARLDAGTLSARLKAVLASLSDDDREVLLLVAWERLTPAEAGEALGLTGVAARSRLHRARLRAQETLDTLETIEA